MSFEEILLDAIDEEFSSLSETCQKIIYYYLKNEHNIDRQEIPSKIEEFSEAIESMFKDGAKILQIRIMENLFRKMGYINKSLYDKESLDFIEYIEAIKATMYQQKGIKIPLLSNVL
ncbi:MAG: hypothetical protein P8Y18_07930 [Candidatus Bathyarchaeota archaeon]